MYSPINAAAPRFTPACNAHTHMTHYELRTISPQILRLHHYMPFYLYETITLFGAIGLVIITVTCSDCCCFTCDDSGCLVPSNISYSFKLSLSTISGFREDHRLHRGERDSQGENRWAQFIINDLYFRREQG